MDNNIPIDNADNESSGRSTDKDQSLALELTVRAASAKTLDEISFILTNDLRTLTNFDRCFLIMHLGGKTRVTAATNQPIQVRNTEIETYLLETASHMRDVNQPIILSKQDDENIVTNQDITSELRAALETYMRRSESRYIGLIPLMYNDTVVAHLLMEYFGDNAPQKRPLTLTMRMAPVMAAALTGRWLFEKKPRLKDFLRWESTLGVTPGKRSIRYIVVITIICALLTLFLFEIPVHVYVGGEAVIEPKEKLFAFCKLGGLLDKVFVNQGSHVEAGQILARLDAKELEHNIKREERHFEILTKDIDLLRTKAIDDPSTIARSKLLELERKNVSEQLRYLNWQRQFLEIRSPVTGIVVTKDVETLSGKRLEPGEPLCEIAKPGLLVAAVYVPDDRIMEVARDQRGSIYLNSDPRRGYQVTVDDIAPRSEVLSRLGNVYRVTGQFNVKASSIRVGMKGVGKIQTGTANLWRLMERRIMSRLNQLSLYFW